MDHFSGLQLLGYAASILIATSLLMRSIVRLRLINMAGAATFSVYGFLIGAYPVAILNLMTTAINIVQLVRLQRRREIFRTIEIRPDSPYLEYFLDFQAADIRHFFPRFHYDGSGPQAGRLVALVLRDLVPAGVLLGTMAGNRLDVQLDYVVPQYRDLKVGRFLFHDEADFFLRRGITEIASPADTREHAEYLERMGFTRAADGTYRLNVMEAASGR
jgi:GNAT superfamily N-acetyltransferase